MEMKKVPNAEYQMLNIQSAPFAFANSQTDA